MVKFEIVDRPATASGRAAAPNPYVEVMEAMVSLPLSQAVKFEPEGKHSAQVVARRLRAIAPENRTVRTKFDAETNTVQAWLTEKKAKAPTPEQVAAKMDAKGDGKSDAETDAKPDTTAAAPAEPTKATPKTNARKGAA